MCRVFRLFLLGWRLAHSGPPRRRVRRATPPFSGEPRRDEDASPNPCAHSPARRRHAGHARGGQRQRVLEGAGRLRHRRRREPARRRRGDWATAWTSRPAPTAGRSSIYTDSTTGEDGRILAKRWTGTAWQMISPAAGINDPSHWRRGPAARDLAGRHALRRLGHARAGRRARSTCGDAPRTGTVWEELGGSDAARAASPESTGRVVSDFSLAVGDDDLPVVAFAFPGPEARHRLPRARQRHRAASGLREEVHGRSAGLAIPWLGSIRHREHKRRRRERGDQLHRRRRELCAALGAQAIAGDRQRGSADRRLHLRDVLPLDQRSAGVRPGQQRDLRDPLRE